MKFAKSGSVQGNQKDSRVLPQELREKLDGMLLGDAIDKKLIDVDFNNPFLDVTDTYSGENGSQSYTRMVLNTRQGRITVSETLAKGAIVNYIDRLGDLTFRAGENEQGQPYFRLGKPGGGVTTSVKKAAVFSEIDAV